MKRIFENMDLAKKVLKSNNKDQDDPSFIELKDMLGSSIGLIGLFAHFHYNRKASIDTLKGLLNTLKRKKNLLKYLPDISGKQLINYKSIEELEDDINTIEEWRTYHKEFVVNLRAEFKEKAKGDSELKNYWTQLKESDKKAILAFISTQVRYSGSFTQFKEDILSTSFLDMADTINEIENTEGAYIIYNENQIVVAEIWSKKASAKIGSSSWCISGNGAYRWDNYNNPKLNNKQYFIWNFRVSSGDYDSRVGVTIKRDGTQYTLSLLDNQTHGKNIDSYCKEYNIPREIFKGINYEIEHERIVKHWGMSDIVARNLIDNNLADMYKSELPLKYKIILGYEVGSLGDKKSKILVGNFDEEIVIINELSLDDVFEKRENVPNWFYDLDFIDRVRIANTYNDANLKVLFFEEIDNDDIAINYNRWEWKITINISLDDYCYDVLNMETDTYRQIAYYDYQFGYDEDFEYLIHYINKENFEELKKISKLFIVAKPHLCEDLLDEDIDDIDDMKHFLITLNDTEELDFSDFISELIYEASELYLADHNTFKNNELGSYNNEEWEINFSDLVENFDKNGIFDGSLKDYIESHPCDISELEFNSHGDYFYMSDYDLNAIQANKSLTILLDNFELNPDIYLSKVQTLKNNKFKLINRGGYNENYVWFLELDNINYWLFDSDIDFEDEVQEIVMYNTNVKSDISNKWKSESKKILLKPSEISVSKSPKDPNQLELQLEHIMRYRKFIKNRFL